MAFGSFDILHEGHLNYLKQAKKYGDYLVVIVARDENIEKFKGKKPKHNESQRLNNIKKLNFADEAVLGHKDDILKVLEEYKPDIICLGYDQKTIDENKLREELEKRNIKAKIARCRPFKPEVYKSSKIRN
ncbi:FAD synthase [Candidatus Woesearchaeota archaeon]|nr:FAD synthase [Candidatus Woesearchaeota archaeon]